MKYVVTFRDKTSLTVDKTKGEKLKEILLSPRMPANIELDGALYRTSEIVTVKKSNIDDVYEVFPELKAIEAKNRCRGQFSIQWEINMLAQRSGKDWAKKIQSKPWRKGVYEKLKGTDKKWCDYKTGKCYCEPQYLSIRKRYAML